MHLACLQDYYVQGGVYGMNGRRIRMHLHPGRDASSRSEKYTSRNGSMPECGCIHGCICSQMQMPPWMHRNEDASKFVACIQPTHPCWVHRASCDDLGCILTHGARTGTPVHE
ncbi:hypothetical protein EXIGLDRAFT_726569 [Exidia glandulosa HHB12029]|uniref:Uncharacterized protein n=1 Tax=Exidia glandulosa HHB12029 TaxID=1314781 RepID=A0A165DNJ4_EXIGL|nr:hypothetical protein EXIGLDRAFT_726569 [Exidia glandulosa HHB12029]